MAIQFNSINLAVVSDRTMRKYIAKLQGSSDQDTTTNMDIDKLLWRELKQENRELKQENQALKHENQVLNQENQALKRENQENQENQALKHANQVYQENQALKHAYSECCKKLQDFGIPIPVLIGYSKNSVPVTRGGSIIENPTKENPVKENLIKENTVKENLIKVSMLHYIRDTWVDASPKGATGNIFVGGSSEKHHYKDGEKMRIRIYNLHHFPIQFIVVQKIPQGPYERVTANGVKIASAPNNLFGAKGKLLAPYQDVFLKDCKITGDMDVYIYEFIIEVWLESKANACAQFSRTAIISRDSRALNLLDSNDLELPSPTSPLSIKVLSPVASKQEESEKIF